MKKNVWVINHYSIGMMKSKGGRHYWFAKFLKQKDFAPVVFGCNASRGKSKEEIPAGQNWVVKTDPEIDVPFVCVKGTEYKGNGNGLGRWLNMLDFYRQVKKAAKQYAASHGKPDVVYASSVHPFAVLAGIRIAKHFRVPCIGEIRDLWPESLVAYGILSAKHPVTWALRRLEKYLYRKCDALIFTMGGAYDYIREQGWEKIVPEEKVYHLNNGTDLEQFDAFKKEHPVEDPDLTDPDTFKVVYAGSIRRVNNLGLLLDAAKLVKDPRIRFLIWGYGDERERLKARVQNEHIDNVVFKGYVQKQSVPFITSMADLNLAHNEPSRMLLYGVSFNKIFDYLAAGKPVLCDFPSRYNPVIESNAGVETKDGDPAETAAAVEQMASLTPEEYRVFCENARKAAVEVYDFRCLTDRLIDIIEKTERR